MDSENIKRQFSSRIRENYEDFLKDWLSQEPEELVSLAEEISAVKMLAEALPATASEADMAYLLHFENPLEVVRDGLMRYDGAGMTDALAHTLCTIRWNADLLDTYAPSEGHLSTPKEPITVREILQQHPGDSFDMMTPGDFVYLTPEKAQALLDGERVMGNPGCSSCGMEITAEELLPQKIQNANYADGAWRLLSYWEPEMEQNPLEQGVTMC